jgi:hypothetical protein
MSVIVNGRRTIVMHGEEPFAIVARMLHIGT